MKRIYVIISAVLLICISGFAQSGNTKIFTIFTSGGCGCTGSGGAPKTFTTHEQVVSMLQKACPDIDFIVWKGTNPDGLTEIEKNKDNYHGMLVVGELHGDYRLAFTGLPTIVVYNLWEFNAGHPWNLFATGKAPEGSVLAGGIDYKAVKILNAQLDRRNTCTAAVRDSMFNDLVYKIKLIKIIKELAETRILMVTNSVDENIAEVNYRGDINQSFPEYHNLNYTQKMKELYGVEIVRVGAEEFYEACSKVNMREAERIADEWIKNAQRVEVNRNEIVKTARGYLAHDALREKYKCNAVSTHIRSVAAGDQLKDRYNPGVGLELGFKPRGIMAVCQNYPDLLISEIIAYKLTGRHSMFGDVMYDAANSVEIILHCGIPVYIYGDERRLPYIIRPHAESPVRDKPDEPGASTGMTAEWPAGEPVTIWEMHSLHGKIRLHTGDVVDGHKIYTGGEDIYNIMCTAKVIAKVDVKKLQDQFMPSYYGIHTVATPGDIRQQIKDMAVLLGLKTDESDK